MSLDGDVGAETSTPLPQGSTRVAFQGEPGAYSELAAREAVGPSIETVPCVSFREVFSAVLDGSVDSGILPIENSTAGSITETYDLLLESGVSIVGEVFLPIVHCLMVRPGSDLERIRRVSSHPQALAQCRRLIEDRGLSPHPRSDTAGAARWLAESGTEEDAALASALAADLYGLTVVMHGVQTEETNTTRFILVRTNSLAAPCDRPKTSLVLELSHRPSALYQALKAFGEGGLNLTKIESRPIPDRNWEYRFYLDFEGHRNEPQVDVVLRSLHEIVARVIVFGSYPSAL